MIKLRVAWCLLSSLIYSVLTLPLDFLGLFLVPIAIANLRQEISPVTGRQIVNAPSWLWLWGNDEDGLCATWYALEKWKGWPWWWKCWVWSACRNKTNNLRFVTWLHPPPDAERLKFVICGGGKWILLWQGWASRLIGYNYEWTIGWKYEPRDTVEAVTDWRRFGVGFGVRWVRS